MGYYLCMDDGVQILHVRGLLQRSTCARLMVFKYCMCVGYCRRQLVRVDDGVQILGLLQRSTCARMIRSVQISKLKPWWWWRWSNRHRSRWYFAAKLIAGNLCDVSTGRCVISLMASHHNQFVAG